jgi:hypothetical protein
MPAQGMCQGQDSLHKGCVEWLVETFDGNRIRQLMQPPHHLGAQAPAQIHQRYFLKLNEEAITTYCNAIV